MGLAGNLMWWLQTRRVTNMLDWTLYQGLIAALAVAGVSVALIAWRWPRTRKDDLATGMPSPVLYSAGTDYPVIHATNGVPTLQQLIKGIDIDAKQRGVAERLYEAGLEQFNRYVNNRDGVIEESRSEMASLTDSLSEPDLPLAEAVGIELASSTNQEERAAARVEFDGLGPQAQTYAQHKRRELEAQRTIARDLEKNVPRTDYTSVKARIASGNVSLDSITSELPISWQSIRTLTNKVERPKITEKQPPRKFLHVIFHTRDQGILEDKRAERDGDWIISDRHDMMVPYQKPTRLFKFVQHGKPPVQTGEVIFVDRDPSSEWETEFWRQGGRLDQVYLRARAGRSPEQLRSAYRRRQIKRAGWMVASLMLIVDIILVII